MASYIHRYAEPCGKGRGIMRVDVVVDDRLISELSGTEGSPAPFETVKAHEEKVMLRGS